MVAHWEKKTRDVEYVENTVKERGKFLYKLIVEDPEQYLSNPPIIYRYNECVRITLTYRSASPITYFRYRQHDTTTPGTTPSSNRTPAPAPSPPSPSPPPSPPESPTNVFLTYDPSSPLGRAATTKIKTRHGTDRGRIAASEEKDRIRAANRKSACHSFQEAERIGVAKAIAAERKKKEPSSRWHRGGLGLRKGLSYGELVEKGVRRRRRTRSVDDLFGRRGGGRRELPPDVHDWIS